MSAVVCLVGISGVGKSTVAQRMPGFRVLQSATTRPPRDSDMPGELLYLTREEMARALSAGELLEYAEHGGEQYGLLTPVEPGPYVSPMNAHGVDYLMRTYDRHQMAVLPVAILPPSMDELYRRNHHDPDWTRRSARDHHHGLNPVPLIGTTRYELTIVNYNADATAVGVAFSFSMFVSPKGQQLDAEVEAAIDKALFGQRRLH